LTEVTTNQVHDLLDVPVVETQAVVVVEPRDVAISSEGTQIRNVILELARDANFDVEKLRALSDLQNSVEDRQAERAFNAAFVAMQAELPVIKRDGSLEYEKEKGKPESKYLVSKYARYEDIAKAIQPVLAKHGFSVSFNVHPRTVEGGGLMVSCVLRHIGGHVHQGPDIPVPLDTSGGKNNIQAYGSALSYGKRYGLFAVLNVITEGDDDDGVAAGGQPVSPEEALQIKALVDEAGIADGKTGQERTTAIVEWLNDMLSYPLPKGYRSIRNEDGVRIRRALLSLKDKRDAAKAQETQI
jgi:hypothetical protein